MSKSKSLRLAALLGAVVVIGAAAISAGPTFAAKGGHHGGGQTSGVTLSVSPNPVPAFSLYQVSGCGFVPGEVVTLNQYSPTAISTILTLAATDGCISAVDGTNGPGTYTLKASRGSTMVASITFEVS